MSDYLHVGIMSLSMLLRFYFISHNIFVRSVSISGEWCVARHSIKYDKLPGYFIAFDLYDRLEKKLLFAKTLP